METIQDIGPPDQQKRHPTWPPNGQPTGSWPAEAARGATELGHRAFDHAERPRAHREPRPRPSALAIVAVILGVANALVLGGVVLWHQSSEAGYEARAGDRHRAVMGELTLQRTALYAVIDVAARHHPEAAQVGTDLARTPPPSTAP